jgi:hypothetical protein
MDSMVNNPTRNKLNEASYFLELMTKCFESDDKFTFNLSAFLSASRSITWYMQRQYGKKQGFSDWYCRKQTDMSADTELDYLNKARVEDVHKEYVKTGTTKILHHSTDAYLVKDGETQNIESLKQVKEEPTWQPEPTIVKRFFHNFGKVEVIPFCEKQLKKFSATIDECERLFTS